MITTSSAGREILYCVTYREFDGGENARIHEAAIRSLQNQTNKNFRLVVTNFREKTVIPYLQNSGLRCEFVQSDRDLRLCWSEIISNGFRFIERGKHILLWGPGDLIFEPNFFEEVVRNFQPGQAGTSYPAPWHRNLDELHQGRPYCVKSGKHIGRWMSYSPDAYVIDFVYLDGDVFLDPENRARFERHWINEHLPGYAIALILGSFARSPKVNLFFRSKVRLVVNPRTDEPYVKKLAREKGLNQKQVKELIGQYWSEELTNAQYQTVAAFSKDAGIPESHYSPLNPLRKWTINREFHPVGTNAQKILYRCWLHVWRVRSQITKRVLYWRKKYLGAASV